MRNTDSRPRREGFALPVTLLVMIVIGAVVTGGFYLSSQENDVSVGADLAAEALHAAEYGVEERLGEWRNVDLENISPGVPYVFPVSNGARQIGTYTVRVMPTANNVFMLESEGVAVRGQRSGRRRAATFVRMGRADMPFPGAMNIMGSLKAQGNSRIRGRDQCSPGDTVAGVVARHDSLVTGLQHGTEDRISGSPAVKTEPGMTADALSEFGEVTLQDLIASATQTYHTSDTPNNMAPKTTTVDGVTTCNLTDPENWGDAEPDFPCSSHFPIIHVSGGGEFKLTTGTGQGILIVDGDLEINGNFEFSGVVIVTGKLTMRGTGGGTGKINGSVLVQGETTLDEEDNELSGNALIEYNSCKIRDAFDRVVRIKSFPSRGWLIDPSPIPAI